MAMMNAQRTGQQRSRPISVGGITQVFKITGSSSHVRIVARYNG